MICSSSVARVGTLSALLILSTAAIGFSQQVTGNILGRVTDATGAVVPGASVQIQNVETGFSRTEQTDSGGRYLSRNLPPGSYSVTVQQQGFQTQVKRGIALTVGSDVVVNAEMAVGAVQERMEVTADVPMVETTNATVSGFVSGEQIRDLPLNGRSFAELVLLSPGTLTNSTGNNSAANGFSPRMSVNGGRGDANLFLLDGAVTNDAVNNGATAGGGQLGVEGIREFRVLTHNYSPEYGRTSGAVVSAVTRSGTNEFHGSAYEFLRNSIFDARDFFNPGKLPPFRRNQFGAALGGPFKRDRIFFFVNYEGLRMGRGINTSQTVPDTNFHQGLIPNPAGGGLRSIPVSPAIRPYLDLYPLPNSRLFGDGTGEWIQSFNEVQTEDYAMERMDFRLGDKDNFFWRYVFDPSNDTTPASDLGFYSNGSATNHFVSLGETHIFSGAALNDFRFSFNRTFRAANSSPLSDKITDLSLGFVPGYQIGEMELVGSEGEGGRASGRLGQSGGFPQIYITNLFQITDTVSLVNGAHSLKFGVDLGRPRLNITAGDSARGFFRFSSFENFLTAKPFRFDATNLQVTTRERGWRRILVAWFLQDDYRVSSRLTLNVGLRHEFFTDPTEVNGKSANLINITDPISTLGPAFHAAKLNFAPRVGLAWDPNGNGKTSVRLGVGVYYNQADGRTWQHHAQADSRFAASYRVNNPSFPLGTPAVIPTSAQNTATVQYELATPTVIHYGLEVQRQLMPTVSTRIGYVGSYGYNMTRFTSQNIRIAQILPDGTKLFTANAPLVNPNFSTIGQLRADALGNYNSLQAQLQKTVSSGLEFSVAYTYSKALSESDSTTNSQIRNVSPGTMDINDLGRDYGASGFDQNQTVVFNGHYAMPWDKRLSGGVPRALLGGWALNGIMKAGSGLPFDVGVAFTDFSNVNTPGRPDLLPGFSNNPTQGVTAGCQGITAGQKLGTPDRWFDPCAFKLPTLGTFGNLGRTTVRGPGFHTLDFTLVKNTPLGENKKLEFRAEFFNLFNHANFNLPDSRAGIFTGDGKTHGGAEGRLTATVTRGREIQLGMKLTF